MAKKIVHIITKCVCCLVVLALLGYIGIGFFGGFHLKSIPCGGGFRTTLYETEIENIKAVSTEELTQEQLASIKFNLSTDRDNDKIMVTKYIDSNDKEVKLQCKMNWYWSGNYEWSIQ